MYSSILVLHFSLTAHLIFLSDFDISSIVRGWDGSNCPFKVPSYTTFAGLTRLIAEKLRCYPDFLQLHYRLNSDKQLPISIRSDEEFSMFMDCMRTLHVPPKLANGKMSTCALKPITVFCEDGADWDNTNSSKTSWSGRNKVHLIHPFLFFDIEQSTEGVGSSLFKLGR